MRPENEYLVRETWKQLEPVSDSLVATFYQRLFSASPAAAALFSGTEMTEQRRQLSQVLAEIVRAIDDPDVLIREVAASGAATRPLRGEGPGLRRRGCRARRSHR